MKKECRSTASSEIRPGLIPERQRQDFWATKRGGSQGDKTMKERKMELLRNTLNLRHAGGKHGRGGEPERNNGTKQTTPIISKGKKKANLNSALVEAES